MIKNIIKNATFKNTLTLSGGVVIAHLFVLATTPILTRIFTPNEFGRLGFFMSIVTIFSVISSLKTEQAIVLVDSGKPLYDVKNISISLTVITFITIFTLLVFFDFLIDDSFFLGPNEIDIILLPLGIGFVGLLEIGNNWFTRHKDFTQISIANIITKVGIVLLQIAFGIMIIPEALVLGFLIGNLIGIFYYFKSYKKNNLNYETNFKFILKLNEYPILKKFYYYLAPQSFLNAISQNIPVILLSIYFNDFIVGLYWFAYRIIRIPSALISDSLRKVFYQRACELGNNFTELFKYHIKVTLALGAVAVPFAVVVGFFSPMLFSFFFGEEWKEAGFIAQILVLWWYFLFINTPSVAVIPVLGLQKFLLKYEVILTILRISSFVVGGIKEDYYLSILLFVVVSALMNSYLITYVFMKINKLKLNH